jgi:hypothetical protein
LEVAMPHYGGVGLGVLVVILIIVILLLFGVKV